MSLFFFITDCNCTLNLNIKHSNINNALSSYLSNISNPTIKLVICLVVRSIFLSNVWSDWHYFDIYI